MRARNFALAAHADQTRKWTGEPYIVHPQAVAKMVRAVGGSPVMVAAAWLHDVVEDTPATIPQILDMFGADVADIVFQLTKPHTIRTPDAMTVKLADIIDNTETIVERAGWRVAHDYLEEKRVQVISLLGGSKILHENAVRQIINGLRRLKD